MDHEFIPFKIIFININFMGLKWHFIRRKLYILNFISCMPCLFWFFRGIEISGEALSRLLGLYLQVSIQVKIAWSWIMFFRHRNSSKSCQHFKGKVENGGSGTGRVASIQGKTQYRVLGKKMWHRVAKSSHYFFKGVITCSGEVYS